VIAKYEYSFSINILNEKRISPVYTGPEIDIIFEDENIIALNKPSSVHGHPLTYTETDNCLSFLRQQGKFAALGLNPHEAERGMLYRLDFATSGILVFCKREELFHSWRKNFFHLVKTKYYIAIVDSPGPEIGEYATYLQSYGPKGAKMVEAEEAECSQLARLKIVEKSINTIKGDTIYNGNSFERLMLHALEYDFTINETQTYKMKAPLPDLFRDFLNLNSRS